MTPDREKELLAHVTTGNNLGKPRPKRCPRCLGSLKGREFNEAMGACDRCFEAANEEKSQAALRKAVFERDKGVCAECGMDCEALQQHIARSRAWSLEDQPAQHILLGAYECQVHQLVRLGFPRSDVEAGKTLWEAHHKHERVKNGPDSLANCQTLCLACHAKSTAGLARSRAEKRGSRFPKRRLRGR